MKHTSKMARLGQSHGRARLTEDDVRAIRQWAADCVRDGVAIAYTAKAAEYGVSEGSLRDIVARRTWTHLDGPAPAPRRARERDLTESQLREQLAKHLQNSGGKLPDLNARLKDFELSWHGIEQRIKGRRIPGISASTLVQWMLTQVRPANEAGQREAAVAESAAPAPMVVLKKDHRTRNLAGQRFGRLVASHRVPAPLGHQSAHWHCRCDCGRTVIAAAGALRDDATGGRTSCGCAHPRQHRWAMRESEPFSAVEIREVT